MQQKHTIKRFSFELQTQSSLQSHTLQRKCVKMVKEELVNDIDQLLSGHFSEDEIIRINKIEIDLGNMANESFEKDFVTKCMEALSQKIKSITVNHERSIESDIMKVDEVEISLQQFFFFLSTGKMPWAAHHINFIKWQIAIEETVQLNRDLFRKKFSDFLQQNPQAMERLVMQFNDEFISKLIELFQPDIQEDFEFLITLLKEKKAGDESDLIKKTVFIKLLPALLGAKERMDEKEIQDIMEWINAHSKSVDEKTLLQLKNTIIALAKKTKESLDVKALTETPLKKPLFENTPEEIKKETEEEMDKLKAENEAIYITNAGIIILHPFLQNLFKATGLLQLENFKDNLSKQKAVHLLQYLANGEQQQPEYMMPLNKVLCGLSDEEHIDRFIDLEEAETKEADELLQAVITHWAALKNTSAQGLQETFLQRNGKLSFNETDGYWKLHVERKGMDILLDKIPWGFSYVQLPWMKYALVTEW